MKKLSAAILITTIMVSIFGVLPVSASYPGNRGAYEYADRNECEEKYNISYYTFVVNYDDNTDGKITSVQELTDIFYNDEEILAKYDEAFFEDKFLYRIGRNAGDTSYGVRVTAVSSEGGSVDILLNFIQEDLAGDMVRVPWTVLVELDKSLIDQNISVKEVPFAYAYVGGISYYNHINLLEYDGWNFLEDPVPENRRKIIKSAAELTKFTEASAYLPTYDETYQELIATYDDDFFENKFLLFVNWRYCDGSSIVFGISNVSKKGNLTSIKVVEVEEPSDYPVVDMECDWLIVFEMDSYLLDGDFTLTMQTERGNEVEVISYSPSDKPFEEQYNISYYTDVSYFNDDIESKITSYEELAQQFPDCDEILARYDEAFFEDKFLYRIGYLAPDPSYDVKVTAVTNTENAISIEITVIDNEELVPSIVVPWDIIIEMDKSLADMNISSNLKFKELNGLAKIQYYYGFWKPDSWFSRDDEFEPQRRKVISSVEELTEYMELSSDAPGVGTYYHSVLSSYDEEFFKNKFLVFVNWKCWDGSPLAFELLGIRENNGVIDIEAEEIEIPHDDIVVTEECDWMILFEMDSSLLEKGFSLTIHTAPTQEVEIMSYLPPQKEPLTADAAYDKAFEQSDDTLVELSLGENNGNQVIMVGLDELYYNAERDVYVGIVDSANVSGNTVSNVSILDKVPAKIVYGNLDDDDVVDGADLQIMKLAIKGSKSLEGKWLIASDVDGDGLCDGADLQEFKLKIKNGREFSVLK